MCWHVLMLTVDFNLLTAKRGQRRKIFDLGLLPNTELSKDYVQNIFDVYQTRDLTHSLCSIAQFLCTQNDVLGCCGIRLSAEHDRLGEPENVRVSKNASKNPNAVSRCARCRECVIREAFSTSPSASSRRLYLYVNQHATRLNPRACNDTVWGNVQETTVPVL